MSPPLPWSLSVLPERAFMRPKTSDAAHTKVARAIKTGRLMRPDICEKCGDLGHVSAHHDDYDRPLDVRWLCRRCHRLIHGKPLAARYFSPRPRRAFYSRLSGRPFTEALA
jgi:ribosomal protein S27AE